VREALKKLTAESLVYGLGQAGGRAVQLLLVPVLTRALAPGAYGISELVMGYAQTAVLILVLGMDGALARFFYQEPDREARIRMVSSSFVFRLAAGFAAAALLVLWSDPLADHLMGGAVYRKYLRIGAVTLPFTLIVMFANDVLRVTFQPWKFIILNLAQTVLTTSLALALVVRLDLGVAGVLYGRLAGDALSAVLGVTLIRHALRPRFSRATLRRMLGFGVPVLPALLAFGMMASLDRYVLQRTRSLEELAVYAVAAKFFTVVTFAASAFQLAYAPFAYARAGTPEAPRLFARAFSAYVALGSIGAMVIGEFAPQALAVLVPAPYHAAALPGLLLAFAAVALGAYTVTAIGIALALKTPLLGVCAGGAALVALAAQLILTPRLGVVGAALGTLMGYLACAALTYGVAQRVYPLPYRGAKLAVLFALAGGMAIAAQKWSPPGAAGAAIKLGAVLLWVAIATRLDIWNGKAVAGASP
jgi:O-antigen/teichoic acid export membrane protein